MFSILHAAALALSVARQARELNPPRKAPKGYVVKRLPSGLLWARDLRAEREATFNADGTYHAGDCTPGMRKAVRDVIAP